MLRSAGKWVWLMLALGCSGSSPVTSSGRDVAPPGELGISESADTFGQDGVDGTDASDGEPPDATTNPWPDVEAFEEVVEDVCQPACGGIPCQPNGCGGICELCGNGQACGPLGTCAAVGCDASSPESWQTLHEDVRVPIGAVASAGLVRLEKVEVVLWSPSWRRRVLSAKGDVVSETTFDFPGDGGWQTGRFRPDEGGLLAVATYYPKSNKQGQAGFVRLDDIGSLATAAIVMPLETLASAAAPLPGGDVVLTGSRTPPGVNPQSTGFVTRSSASGDVLWTADFADPHTYPVDVDVAADAAIAVVARHDLSGDVTIHFYDADGDVEGNVIVATNAAAYPSQGLTRTGDEWTLHLIGNAESRVIRLSSSGQVLFDADLSNVTLLPRGVVGFEGEWVVAGVRGADQQANPYLAAVGDTGDLLWEREFGGPGRESTEFLTRLADGYLLSGAGAWLAGTGQTTFFIKTDTEGEAPLCD